MFHYPLKHLSVWSKRSNSLVPFAVFLFIVFLAANSAHAAAYVVTTTADSGAGSLRQAVTDANSSPEADTINFSIPSSDANCDANGLCTIMLTTGALPIATDSGALTIVNPAGASKLKISGNDADRIFEMRQSATLTLDGLTITRGGYGLTSPQAAHGVISNFGGNLTILNSVLIQNSGTAIRSDASSSITIVNTTITNNVGGGIIHVGGQLNITGSTISNNGLNPSGSVMGHAGIYANGRMMIINSTISGNHGTAVGGIWGGGATDHYLINTTVTGNRGSGEGGGLVAYQARFNLRNTIVSGNTAQRIAPEIFLYRFSYLTSLGNNLIGDISSVGGQPITWHPSDLLNRNARLAPLANNGGATATHAFLPDSLAINGGNNCVLTANGCGDNNPAVPVDQRGRPRVGTIDIGAYEYSARSPFDFDSDGRADLSVFRPSDGGWYRIDSTTNAFSGVGFGVSGDRSVPADFDGDQKTDIAVFRDGAWYILRSSDNAFATVSFGQTGDVPVVGDFDGDAKADQAVFRAGNWYLNRSTGGFAAVSFGIASDKPVAADYDGDNKTDVAVYRDGNWYLLRSSDGGFAGVSFGTAGDIAVPADYDGDGKADQAVYRGGAWYLNQSTGGFTAVNFGQTGDVPVPADYDGDGRADTAVFRNGTWYLNRTTAGFSAVSFGASGDLPIPSAFLQ